MTDGTSFPRLPKYTLGVEDGELDGEEEGEEPGTKIAAVTDKIQMNSCKYKTDLVPGPAKRLAIPVSLAFRQNNTNIKTYQTLFFFVF